ncbi:MAG: hypothetical protein LQ352_001611 [Teloschistes flavicans]|nr:MAG: hypothetical protein LQ352_001611 [Teloschistes flavicans]
MAGDHLSIDQKVLYSPFLPLGLPPHIHPRLRLLDPKTPYVPSIQLSNTLLITKIVTVSHDSHPSSSAPTDSPFPDIDVSSPLPILIRASNGKSKRNRSSKIRISTVVQPHEIEGFFTRYAEVMKAGTPMLKKRDRSGRKKVAKAKKKQKVDGGEKKS